MSLRAQFFAFDDALAGHGVPPLTEWWRDGLGAWLDSYETGGALELVACVGRGASKSTALYKLATFFTLFGDFTIPPGERHFAIVLSRLKEEASKGISIIGRWLTMLGVAHKPAGDVIEIASMPRGIRVVAASVAATSGFRAYAIFKDERSKWASSSTTDDFDASEIDTSAAAMTATHANAPVLAFGSAWAAAGDFYDAIMTGTTPDRMVLGPTPTWVAAPHITEAGTRKKEPDPRRHAREYECRFVGTIGALDVDQLAACVRPLHPDSDALAGPEIVIDSSGGKCDAYTAFAFQWVSEPCSEPEQLMRDITDPTTGEVIARQVAVVLDPAGNPIRNPAWHPPVARLSLLAMWAWEGPTAETMATSDVASAVRDLARQVGATRIWGDQHMAWGWKSEFAKLGLPFIERAWTNPSKVDAVGRLRQWCRERTLVISPGVKADKLIGEARHFEETILPSGAISFAGRGRHHDDRIMTVMLAARVDAEGELRGSPIAARRGVRERTGSEFQGTF